MTLSMNAQTSDSPENLALHATTTASSVLSSRFPATNAADGVISDDSRWLNGRVDQPTWLMFEFDEPKLIRGITLHSGYKNGHAVFSFSTEYRKNGKWYELDSARISANSRQTLSIPFDEEVIADALRLNFGKPDEGKVKIREVQIWQTMPHLLPPGESIAIFLNQAGFNLGAPKRFTMPDASDGTPFHLVEAKTSEAVFEGTIHRQIGDFSAFDPALAGTYVIRVNDEKSDPFTISPWLIERATYQLAMDFLIQSRNRTGNIKRPASGSFGWRDDHHFAFVLTTLVDQYLSNPQAYERMPSQVHYESPRDNAWGALEAYNEEAPDIVKLIHWGADNIVTQQLTHELLKGELASFLYAWPWLKSWLPEQNYTIVRDFALAHWADETVGHRNYPHDETNKRGHDLFAPKTDYGTTKGANPPGRSVLPNILMWAAMQRENHPLAEKFRDAARTEVAWMVANIDWNDPMTTKGQRQSENITPMALAAFARLDPEGLPIGFDNFIERWVDVAIRRSDNLWDFRRVSDTEWVPDDPNSFSKWNEPGNVAGFPAAALDMAGLIQDPVKRTRLRTLAYAQLDNVFGRNPTGRHFSYDAPAEIEGVERGWYSFNPGGIGQLSNVPFVLDGSPKNAHYPFNPGLGDIGWVEGWVNFNTAYNRSLAALSFFESKINLIQKQNEVVVSLQTALNFDDTQSEPVQLTMTTTGGDWESILLSMPTQLASSLTGQIKLDYTGSPTPENGAIEVRANETIQVGYGYGHRRVSANLPASENAASDLK